MRGDRYVVLGLARPRASWFSEVARWATSGAAPLEFRKCLSVEELRVRLADARPASAILVDGDHPSLDRDLEDVARQAGCAVFVVGPCRRSIRPDVVLPVDLTREALLDALAGCAELVVAASDVPADRPGVRIPVERGLLVTVCGPGGTGSSTAAAATAQGMVGHAVGRVLLADLALNGEQALLHDVRDVAPGVQELVEGHRYGDVGDSDVRQLVFDVGRGYDLLLGLRRARHWSLLRPRAVAAALETLRGCYGAVVADVSGDVEGEAEGGSADVEHRNLLARRAVLGADVVAVVGRPTVKGMHALVRVLAELGDAGVEPARMLPVMACSPRSPRGRADVSAAVADLVGPVLHGPTAPMVHLPRRRVDDAIRDGRPLPEPLPRILVRAVDAVIERVGRVDAGPPDAPVPVAPGSLGLAGGVV